MKVYIVTAYSLGDTWIQGIYTSERLALAHIRTLEDTDDKTTSYALDEHEVLGADD